MLITEYCHLFTTKFNLVSLVCSLKISIIVGYSGTIIFLGVGNRYAT
jgi:hypothetical protein